MKLFTYGLLRPGSEFFEKNLKDKVKSVEYAYTQGELCNVKNEGYTGLIPGTDKVDGRLLTFEDDSLLKLIDDYEDEGKIYERKECDVFVFNPAFPVNNRDVIKAWVYVLKPEYADAVEPSGGGCGCGGCDSCG